jgi:N-acetylmuramoyl-L-alanine amidase
VPAALGRAKARPYNIVATLQLRGGVRRSFVVVFRRFGMLLDVARYAYNSARRKFLSAVIGLLLFFAVSHLSWGARHARGVVGARDTRARESGAASNRPLQAAASPTAQQTPPPTANPPQPGVTSTGGAAQTPTQAPAGANTVVLDPAHGGTDLGARGTGGIHESDIVLEFAAQVRAALESQGFQVVQTRQGNANPSFDDRSAMANAQRGAIFVTLHIASTGTPGTARVYVMNDLPTGTDATGLIPWDRAQAPFASLSRKLGDQVQLLLAQRFKGSPSVAQTASVRQLRTTAAPAIAVEISSVTVEDRAQLDHMAPGVADAIARGAAAFRPTYVLPANPGERP